jgi:4-methylaminobutanoate oxidase (formaldehyde-forming)
MKSSAIDTWARSHGARLGEAAGWRIVEDYGSVEAEVAAARDGVAQADMSAHGKVQIEGEAAASVIRAGLGGAPEGVGAGWRGEASEAYCIRPDLFLVLTPPGGEGAVVARLEAARAGHSGLVTVTDLTHGLAALSVIGPHSRDVLGRLCALNLADDVFPNRSARATSVAKTRQVIARRDVGGVLAYTLVGARSLAGYLWEALIETAQAWGGAPIGAHAVEALATGTKERD